MRTCHCRTQVLTRLLNPQAHIHWQEQRHFLRGLGLQGGTCTSTAGAQERLAPRWEPCRACFSPFPASPGLGSTGTSQAVAMATAGGPDAAEKVLWIPEGEVQS